MLCIDSVFASEGLTGIDGPKKILQINCTGSFSGTKRSFLASSDFFLVITTSLLRWEQIKLLRYLQSTVWLYRNPCKYGMYIWNGLVWMWFLPFKGIRSDRSPEHRVNYYIYHIYLLRARGPRPTGLCHRRHNTCLSPGHGHNCHSRPVLLLHPYGRRGRPCLPVLQCWNGPLGTSLSGSRMGHRPVL